MKLNNIMKNIIDSDKECFMTYLVMFDKISSYTIRKDTGKIVQHPSSSSCLDKDRLDIKFNPHATKKILCGNDHCKKTK